MEKRRLFLSIAMLLFGALACSQLPGGIVLTTVTPQPVTILPVISTTVPPSIVTVIVTATDTPTPPPVIDTSSIESTQPPLSTEAITPDSVMIMGEHLVLSGHTLSCIGRGYGVLPKAIAEANGIELTSTLFVGQVLKIPAVQWANIPAGPVCPPQFPSAFPGLPTTGTISQPTLQLPDTLSPNDTPIAATFTATFAPQSTPIPQSPDTSTPTNPPFPATPSNTPGIIHPSDTPTLVAPSLTPTLFSPDPVETTPPPGPTGVPPNPPQPTVLIPLPLTPICPRGCP